MATALIDSVLHWRRKLDKDPDDDYILNVIRKLSKVPITREILEATHIGKTIRKLAKRDDIVGEKAKTVLKKWRDIFANQGSDKNQKLSNDSKKENVNKESKSSSKHSSYEKTVQSQKQSSHYRELKEKSDSLSPSLSEQSSKKYVNGSYKANNSTESSHSLYKYDVKERNSNYLDYDPHTESSEGYNPECPELFPTDKPVKTKKPILVETYEPSSVKRTLTDDKEQNEKSRHKKLKSGSHSSSDDASDSKKSEKKDKYSLNKDKTKHNSHSSTLKKEYNEVKSHSTKKHESVNDTKKTKCKESSETDRTKLKKPKVKILSSEEFTSSEVSFEDCLGFNDIVSLKKNSKSHASTKKQTSSSNPKGKPIEKSKKDPPKTVLPDQKVKVSKDSSSHGKKGKVSQDSSTNVSKTKVSKDSSHSNKDIPFVVPKPSSKINLTDVISTLPEIQPNYHPLPRSPEFYSPKKKVLSNEEAIKYMSSRKEKTAVYSGRKCSNFSTEPLSLFEICTRVLIENIDAIECCGDASFHIMKPILDRCTPNQLYTIEHYNPQFVQDTNELWEAHCKRDYKLSKPMEHETWRELYWRAHDEREKKLKSVTANISKSIATSTPVRQVKLAYVDSHYVKPPRDVARKQAKHGTAVSVNQVKPSPTTPTKPSPRPAPAATVSSSTTSSSSSSSGSAFKKPKLAPLMAKTLKSMKAYRRK